MSVISQAIGDWKKGAISLFYIVLIGFLAPIATVSIFSLLIIFPMYLLGLSLDFWDRNSENVSFLAILILGPYYLGKYWKELPFEN